MQKSTKTLNGYISKTIRSTEMGQLLAYRSGPPLRVRQGVQREKGLKSVSLTLDE